jgi:hypothetical protein
MVPTILLASKKRMRFRAEACSGDGIAHERSMNI